MRSYVNFDKKRPIFMLIKDNLSHIHKKISHVCQKIGRDPQDITLVGVTKFVDIPIIQDAIDQGLMHVAENRVQEAVKKFLQLDARGHTITRHLIGHLQTNKVKHAVDIFDLIQSVDSLKLAQAIDKYAQAANKTMGILVQINTSGEEQKFGMNKEEAMTLIEDIRQLEHIRIKGLMTMAPLVEDTSVIRQCFKDLKNIYDRCADIYSSDQRVSMTYLSMGMSADYEMAIEEGSNMIRIGRAIFHHE